MIKSISKENCNDKYIQSETNLDNSCHLIVSPDEILYLKIRSGVIVNNYLNDGLFPFFSNNYSSIIY